MKKQASREPRVDAVKTGGLSGVARLREMDVPGQQVVNPDPWARFGFSGRLPRYPWFHGRSIAPETSPRHRELPELFRL